MNINEQERIRLEEIYQTFLNDEKIKKMKGINMHRGSNTYVHSFKVAKKSIKRAIKSRKKNIDFNVVLIGAILHDYYLYDWRVERNKRKKHGRNHPNISSENATRDFQISDKIKKVIKSHMWPINIKEFPTSIEAKIVSISDKIVSLGEALTSIAFKNKRKEKYLAYISHLF